MAVISALNIHAAAAVLGATFDSSRRRRFDCRGSSSSGSSGGSYGGDR